MVEEPEPEPEPVPEPEIPEEIKDLNENEDDKCPRKRVKNQSLH